MSMSPLIAASLFGRPIGTYYDDFRWGRLELYAKDGNLVVASFGIDVTYQCSPRLIETLYLDHQAEIEETAP